jgi:hypothetical protein
MGRGSTTRPAGPLGREPAVDGGGNEELAVAIEVFVDGSVLQVGVASEDQTKESRSSADSTGRPVTISVRIA